MRTHIQTLVTIFLVIFTLVPGALYAQEYASADAASDPAGAEATVAERVLINVTQYIDQWLLEPPEVLADSQFQQGSCPTTTARRSLRSRFLRRVNKQLGLPAGYIPEKLVEVAPHVRTRGGKQICLEETTAVNLAEMFAAAKEAGYDLAITSGFRSQGKQGELYAKYAPLYNNGHVDRVAPARNSEHNLGTAVDMGVYIAGEYVGGNRFGQTEAYQWVQANNYKFGFNESYQRNNQHLTKYGYEPWHQRFMGKYTATMLNRLNTSLAVEYDLRSPEEFLAEAFGFEVGIGG